MDNQVDIKCEEVMSPDNNQIRMFLIPEVAETTFENVASMKSIDNENVEVQNTGIFIIF